MPFLLSGRAGILGCRAGTGGAGIVMQDAQTSGVCLGFFPNEKQRCSWAERGWAEMDLYPGHSKCHPPLVALGTSGTCGCCWTGCDKRLCTLRGDSCVPCEPTQTPNSPTLALFQPSQTTAQPHLHQEPLSAPPNGRIWGQRDLLQQGHPQLGRSAHEPAEN